MTTGERQIPGMEFTTIGALASGAMEEVHFIQDEIGLQKHPATRAFENLQLIDRLRTLPHVQQYLSATEKSIRILGTRYGIWSTLATGLSVSSAGLETLWYGGSHSTVLHRTQLAVDEEALRKAYKVTNLKLHLHKHFIERMANLDPEEIIEKFRKAITSQIKPVN